MPKTYAALAAASFLLAGCTAADVPPSPPAPPSSPSPAYQALGHEPGWKLNITDEEIHYIGDYGDTDIRQKNSGKNQQGTQTRYDTARLSIVIDDIMCSDSMVERQYQHRVSVTADGKKVTGCGGKLVPPATLNGTSWQIEHIEGAPAIPDAEAQLAFADGRLSGTAGCNRLMGSFTQSKDALSFAQIATTRMACAPALMQQERRLVDALGQVQTWEFSPDGLLLLRGQTEVLVRLRQIF